MAQHLNGQVAVVTGGGGGIGRGVAKELAAQGAKVLVNDLGGALDGTGSSKGPADQTVDEIRSAGGEAAANYDSVITMDGGEKIVRSAVDTFGRLDISIHLAGILRDRMVFNMTEEEWDAVISVHLKGLFAVMKPSSIIMRQQRSGRIIGVSSTAGLYGNPGQVNYGAAKEGVAGFVKTVARDMGRYGVTVNAIVPLADTRMTQTITDQTRELRARSSGGLEALDTRQDPHDVAPVVAFLCTEEAHDINGQMIFVAGGTVGLMNNPYAARTIRKLGRWTLEEIAQLLPQTIGRDLINPAPQVQAKG